ncbi:hypothetical protein LCGC14_1982760, partial [marine sediment metagenome]
MPEVTRKSIRINWDQLKNSTEMDVDDWNDMNKRLDMWAKYHQYGLNVACANIIMAHLD